MSTEYLGPFDLENDIIESNVTRSGPGTFRLGHNDVWGQLNVRFIGRSDDDLKAELRRQAAKRKYTRFMFQSADTSRQAFERNCREYHKYRGNGYLDNSKHPIIPAGHAYPCPICKKIVYPSSTEKPVADAQQKSKSDGMVLRLADDEQVELNLKPWEMDDDGNRIRRSVTDAEEAKPWHFDDPNLVALDVEEMVKADKELTHHDKPEEEEEEEKKPVMPDWLENDPNEPNVSKEPQQKPGVPEWLVNDPDEPNEPPKPEDSAHPIHPTQQKPKKAVNKKPWEVDE